MATRPPMHPDHFGTLVIGLALLALISPALYVWAFGL